MKLGFVSAILPDLSVEEVFRFAAQTGYQSLELMCWPAGKAERRYAGVTHVDVTDMDDRSAEALLCLSADTGVEISGLGYFPNPLAPSKEEADVAVAHLKKVIAALKKLGLPVVSTFIGRDWTRSIDDNWPRFVETWSELMRVADDNGVRIAIEHCPMLFSRDEWPGGKNLPQSPAIWRRMFDSIASPNLGLCFDPSHFVWQMMDYIRPIYEFRDRIFRVHFKDAKLDRYRLDQVGILAHPLEFHTPKLPGLGDVDWGSFISALNDIGYRGPANVEVEDRAYEATLEDRKRALIQSHTYLRQFIAK